jgi:hypothetical protein
MLLRSKAADTFDHRTTSRAENRLAPDHPTRIDAQRLCKI